jgi:N-acetylmuramoyl-L-alanine amidase
VAESERRPGRRKPGPARKDEFVSRLEEVSREIQDPAAKLRFLRTSLSHREAKRKALSPLRNALRRVTGRGVEAPIDPLGARALLGEPRRGEAVARSLAVGLVLAGVAFGAAMALRAPRTSASSAPVAAAARQREPVAEPLPMLPAAVTPSAIWLVEKGKDWELYSNGLRIDTSHSVAGEARRFKVFEAGVGMRDEVYAKPVGIVFHTSESDIWPLEASFNENLRDSTQRLLRYLVRNRCYNYLIDRFGRVYRIVDEETKANHAGTSIWANGKTIYLNLNASFLGVSFETRWEGGRALPITEAQLAAGRNLTEYLRQRWDIPGSMCVGHGLVSVNPQKHLIGNHMDWARGFPWAAFGLPDQYAQPPASVARFGFGYDDDFLKVLGRPWPGVLEAEAGLARDAKRAGKGEDDVRRERRALYDEWRTDLTHDEDQSRASLKAGFTPRGPRSQQSGG